MKIIIKKAGQQLLADGGRGVVVQGFTRGTGKPGIIDCGVVSWVCVYEKTYQICTLNMDRVLYVDNSFLKSYFKIKGFNSLYH